jgi:hypothetical protein
MTEAKALVYKNRTYFARKFLGAKCRERKDRKEKARGRG